jgi:hypothetical protein
MNRDGYRDQIVTCDVGVSLHSKTHPLFMKYSTLTTKPPRQLSGRGTNPGIIRQCNALKPDMYMYASYNGMILILG